MRVRTSVGAILCAASLSSASLFNWAYSTYDYYVVEYNPNLGVSLDGTLQTLGLQLVGPVGELANTWLTRQRKPPVETVVGETPERLWKRLRTTSDVLSKRDSMVGAAIRSLSLQVPRQRAKRAPPPPTSSYNPESARSIALHFDIEDPNFSDQWHLVNEDAPEHSMNATGIWDMGITGHGVITGLIDDGLDFESDDLADNFVRA
jgi:kexin